MLDEPKVLLRSLTAGSCRPTKGVGLYKQQDCGNGMKFINCNELLALIVIQDY